MTAAPGARAGTAPLARVGLVSLEPWDETWRRNQHLVHHLVADGAVTEVVLVEPPARRGRTLRPEPGVRVVRPRRLLPRRAGGLVATGLALRRGALRGVDVVWVNDPELGRHCVGRTPALYDVTDDWREFAPLPRIARRIARAEAWLARAAATVVCSPVLRDRWRERYGVDAALVPNGVDAAPYATAVPHRYNGPGPHVGYVGTLAEQRLDVDLLVALAAHPGTGTVHLVGPDSLGDAARARLRATPGLVVHPPVPAGQVPGRVLGLDVLVCPHLVTPFTLSLDAIKSREYLASGRPVVATPTSGFQDLAGHGVVLADRDGFAAAVAAAAQHPVTPTPVTGASWAERAARFGELLGQAAAR